jgi:hypothetical protein
MRMKLFTRTIVPVAALLLAACSSEAPRQAADPTPEPAAPEPVTGQTGFFEMYKLARNWAKDLQGLRINSINHIDVKSQPGKAPIWEAVFVSPMKKEMRSFSYSVMDVSAATRKGVVAGPTSPWGGSKPGAKPFETPAIKIDSDKAYEVALSKAGDQAKKNTGKPVTFLLEQTERFPNPAWRVIWGESVSSSTFSVFVDATTGRYLRTVR